MNGHIRPTDDFASTKFGLLRFIFSSFERSEIHVSVKRLRLAWNALDWSAFSSWNSRTLGECAKSKCGASKQGKKNAIDFSPPKIEATKMKKKSRCWTNVARTIDTYCTKTNFAIRWWLKVSSPLFPINAHLRVAFALRARVHSCEDRTSCMAWVRMSGVAAAHADQFVVD